MKEVSRKAKDNKGFTLVELIIVVTIIAMLIAMIAPNLTSFLGTASDTTMRANAKTAYTSVNAWVTQQRVAGVSLESIGENNPLIIELKDDGKTLHVTAAQGSYTGMSTYGQLVDLFNAGEFNSTTQIHIWFTSNYTVPKVVWVEGGESAVYPD